MLKKIVQNHVVANLVTLLVIAAGFLSYQLLAREQDPEVNFNWVQIFTPYPGASAEDVEKEITAPLEDAIRRVSDIKFVSSTSREGMSSILIRFNLIDQTAFDKRVTDIRREVQAKYNAELPRDAREPELYEIVSSNAFPAAMVVITGQGDDETLRKTAEALRKDLERLGGVERVDPVGLMKPELHVAFDPNRLDAFHVSPVDVADSLQVHFRDLAAGSVGLGDQNWLIRLKGRSADPEYIAHLPILQAATVTPVDEVAEVSRTTEKVTQEVAFRGKPAKLLLVFKEGGANTLQLLDEIQHFISDRTPQLQSLGMEMVLVDDQSVRTRESIRIMETNAVYGLALVFVVTWLFLGWRLSLLVTSCIPFVIAGVFWFLYMTGQTLNTTVLLGIVIVLGMLVDDTVVIVEAVNFRLQRGRSALAATVKSLREVAWPVFSSSLTTMAAFLPLMLLPGILGEFMKVIPMVVTVALAVSLVEAFWLMPAHIVALNLRFDQPSRIHQYRLRVSNWLINKYYRALLFVLKRPAVFGVVALLLISSSVLLVYKEYVRTEFFADDPIRLFYVNVDMAPGSGVTATAETLRNIEAVVRAAVPSDELRTVTSVAGYAMTDKDPTFGTNVGQVMVSLLPARDGGKTVDEIIGVLRPQVESIGGPIRVSFLKRSSGPPVGKPIEIKVRGDNYSELRAATDALVTYLGSLPAVSNLTDDDSPGKMELKLTPNTEAIKRAGLTPATVQRVVAMYVDGEIIGQIQDEGEKVELRVLAQRADFQDLDALLKRPVALPNGGKIALGELVHAERRQGKGNIRHYNFRRTITVQADLDKSQMDTFRVNQLAQNKWEEIRLQYPGVTLDFSGELDDIKESLDSLKLLLLVGIGLIYIILGAQFKSYLQPLIILFTIPLAFAGVIFGLFISGNPISLYTLYGVVALTGIAVNSAIVMIDAANQRVAAGMDALQAILYAARRRLLAILITSLTTIGGLLSLAAGWGGHSLLWSPMATAIVWGLGVSTFLTLFVIPLLFWIFAPETLMPRKNRPAPAAAA